MLIGKWIWIWNWRNCHGGDAAQIASTLTGMGCAGCFIKHDDGGHPFELGWDPDRLRSAMAALRAHGLKVGLWGYIYGQAREFHGDAKLGPDAEADMAIQALGYQPDCYVIDVEAEYEFPGSETIAEGYLSKVRSAHPAAHIYYAPLPQPQYHHPQLPYHVFNRHCNGVLPQAYHNAMQMAPQTALERSYQEFRDLGLAEVDIYPAGGAYEPVTAAELAAWAQTAHRLGAKAVSWWSLEHILQRPQARLADAIRAVSAFEPSGGDQMIRYVRTNRAGWATGQPFADGLYTMQAASDFGLPAQARSILLEIEARGPGKLVLVDGGAPEDAGYAGTCGEGISQRRVFLGPDGTVAIGVRDGGFQSLHIRCLAYFP